MASTLPSNPSLDRLRDGARALQRGVRTADPAALATVRQHHPRCDIALARKQFALHDAQLTMARRYGFTGWPALVRYVELTKDLGTDPSAVDERGLDSADRFCALASLRYDADDEPPRWQAPGNFIAALSDSEGAAPRCAVCRTARRRITPDSAGRPARGNRTVGTPAPNSIAR
ncbi:Uncharacterised protein [Mycobacteroides abscessus subsp. abscessus]|nr:Uncharacterised protein [Mycobacteroides abscessus subsp. abscessus]